MQIEDQKRKSTLLCDFVIETTYIKELASQVFNADERARQTPAFQDSCETLDALCDTVSTSIRELKGLLPLIGRPEIVNHPLE